MDLKEVKFNIELINDINKIGLYLAKRDISTLSVSELYNKYGLEKIDMVILLGNSITYSIEVAKQAFENLSAEYLMIVGGIGHSTSYLYDNITKYNRYSDIKSEGRAEADIMKDVLEDVYSVNEKYIIVENQSTNCGDNAEKALNTLRKVKIKPSSVLLIQDPTMQLRSYEAFKKYFEGDELINFINYAPFLPSIKFEGEKVTFQQDYIEGIWGIERYLSLIMGEVPRLRDDEAGYGPKGKNFIGHVDIPKDVLDAYSRINTEIDEHFTRRIIV
ncbi:YdcF family protein [Clostridium manihotivorum]|uniref:YdcF family protein n=1 Tax=Clostridium manihotivorum TaxID=2320868 RepID=A0A3R5UEX8_9CLOT|nr:YdcF family protein [Clostridium manihotivorum]QAA31843.1 YdcF family protein [Clostridium manihotivorum]